MILTVSLIAMLVSINVSLIANSEGADFIIQFGPSENRYDASAPQLVDKKQTLSKSSGKSMPEAKIGLRDSQPKISNDSKVTTSSSENKTKNRPKVEWKKSQPKITNTSKEIVVNDTSNARENRTKIKLKGKMKAKDMPAEIDIAIEDGPVFEAPIINPNTKSFDPNINGVIVTKVQGSAKDLDSTRQMLCLLTKAYNHRVNHDIVVFTSEAIEPDEITSLQKIVHPANLTVQIDNPGLHQMVEDLSPSRKKHLLDRCNVTSTSELHWRSYCWEVSSKGKSREMLAYNWQAEFRSLWIWIHPLLASYNYMLWIDSDAFCTRTWNQDPFAVMERHDLALVGLISNSSKWSIRFFPSKFVFLFLVPLTIEFGIPVV